MPDYTPFPVELITPEGVAFSGDAQILIVPGAAGELGILANHAPLVSLLDPGVVRVTDEGGEVRRFAADDGFVQVRQNRALVLVGEAVPAAEIETADARSRLEAATEAVERARAGDGDLHAARREAGFAEALVKTAGE